MNLLAATLYDPSTAVSKATTATLAMTAIDTTNLRLRFTVPPSGKVRVRMSATLHGATTLPQILLGVMDGATVKGRMAPMTGGPTNAAATSFAKVEADFVVTGLTPGTDTNWDAAYGVETVVASTGLKYGGPNNTTANDAWGGFAFEIWDPMPVYTPATNGVPPTSTIDQRLPSALVGGRMDSSVGAMAADVVTAAALATDAVAEIADGVWDEALSGHVTAGTAGKALSDAGAGGDPWSTALPGAYGAGTAGNIVGNNLNATVSSRSSHAAADIWSVATRRLTDGTNIVLAKGTGVTGFTDLDAAGVRGAVGLASANLDTQLDTLPTAAEIRVEMDANSVDLNSIGALALSIDGKVDVAVSTRLAGAAYVAPDNATITAIEGKVDLVKAKTDSLTFTVAGHLDANTLRVNGVQLIGDGTTTPMHA